MRTRKEIKQFSKEAFEANYWNCVLVGLLVTAVMGAISSIAVIPSLQAAMIAAQAGEDVQSITFSNSATSLLNLLIAGPLTIGTAYFFIKNLWPENRASISPTTPFTEGFKNYGRKLGGYLLMGLYTFLWALLFVVPGIIKGYAYSMTPYILADCPEVKAKDAITLSRKMMNGHKWELFVLNLSYIGWFMLGILTLGFLYPLYVSPWLQSATALFFVEVRAKALADGVITEGQLNGTEPVVA